MRMNLIAITVVLAVILGVGIGFTLVDNNGGNTFTLGKYLKHMKKVHMEEGARYHSAQGKFVIHVGKVETGGNLSVHNISAQIGKYGQVVYNYGKNGRVINPPRRGSDNFTKYIAYRQHILKNYAMKKPNHILEAMITFKKPITVEEFDKFMGEYAITKRFVDGAKVVGGRMSYMASGYDEVLAVDVKGKAQELLKVQNDSRVLLVDINLGDESHLRL